MRTGTGVRRTSTATGSDRNATVLVANPRCGLVVGAGGDVDPRQELLARWLELLGEPDRPGFTEQGPGQGGEAVGLVLHALS